MTTCEVQVSIVIVNYNTCSLLRDCLRSIYEKTEDVTFEVVVSDNGSKDGSLDMLRQEFPQVVVVENNANLGFGTANNRGLEVARGEYVFYLNSDTLLLNNAVKLFYDYWKANEKLNLGALGCNLVDADGEITQSYEKFPSVRKEFMASLHHVAAFAVKNVMKFFGRDISKLRKKPVYQRKTGSVDYVCGADLFMRNTSDARFDERFFLYYEETNMQLALAKKNLRRFIIDGPQIVHLVRGGKSEVDTVVQYGSFSHIQSEISKVRYFKYNHSGTFALFLKFAISVQWLSPYIFKNTKKYFKTLWSV